MIINPTSPSKNYDVRERVKWLRLTAPVVSEQMFLAELVAALEEGREIVIRKEDGSEVSMKRA